MALRWRRWKGGSGGGPVWPPLLSQPEHTTQLTHTTYNCAQLHTNKHTQLQQTALYFKHLAPPKSAATQDSAIAAPLAAKINAQFGSVDALKKNVSAFAMSVFGSGWAWLAVDPKGQLVVTTTANQDNPLMGEEVSGAPRAVPILGIDVWEHA